MKGVAATCLDFVGLPFACMFSSSSMVCVVFASSVLLRRGFGVKPREPAVSPAGAMQGPGQTTLPSHGFGFKGFHFIGNFTVYVAGLRFDHQATSFKNVMQGLRRFKNQYSSNSQKRKGPHLI